MTHAFNLRRKWGAVRLRAKFLMEPMSKGVLACGFIVRAVDGMTHYDVQNYLPQNRRGAGGECTIRNISLGWR